MARIFEGGEFVAMKAVALASEEMHDDCSDRDVSQDGDVTGPNRMRHPRRTRGAGWRWRFHTKSACNERGVSVRMKWGRSICFRECRISPVLLKFPTFVPVGCACLVRRKPGKLPSRRST